jgi:hypothetical protein
LWSPPGAGSCQRGSGGSSHRIRWCRCRSWRPCRRSAHGLLR